MVTVLLLDKNRLEGDRLRGVTVREGTSPKVGSAARIMLDDDHYRDGVVENVYFEGGFVYFDIDRLGEMQAVMYTATLVEKEPEGEDVVAQLSGIRTRAAAQEWGEKQARRLRRDGKVYWMRGKERVYFV